MQKLQVLWTKSAESDLELIVEYLKNDSLDRAKKIFFEIKEACGTLNSNPGRGRTVPELQQIGVAEYKELIHKRWRVIYKAGSTKVYILLVVDSNRNLEDVLFQRLLGKK